ncbi:TolC family protein [Myxococcota bacterium]|nr:TolC family protein [Myxococcota bacterium]
MTRARWTSSSALVALLFASAQIARADEPPADARLTLERAIELARAQARGIVQARGDVLLADVERVRAISGYLPRFDVSLSAAESFIGSPIQEQRSGSIRSQIANELAESPSALPRFDLGPYRDYQLGNQSAPVFQLQLTGRQLVWDGGRTWAVIARTGDLKAQAEAALVTLENDARLAAVQRFYELEKARQGRIAFEQQVVNGEAQLGRVRALVDAGRAKQADLAIVQRNVAEDRINLARRRLAERSAKRALNLTLGRAADTPVEPVLPAAIAADGALSDGTVSTGTVSGGAVSDGTGSLDAPLPSKAELAAIAREHRPELVRSRATLDAARKDVSIAEAGYYPSLSLSASYSRQSRKPARVFDDPTENYFANLSLGLAWNLFEGRATSAAVESAEIRLSQAAASHAELERSVASEVDERHDEVALLREVYVLAREAVRASEEAVRLARGLYEQGRGTLLELRDAELRLTLERVTVIDARLDLETAREALRRAVGAELPIGKEGSE